MRMMSPDGTLGDVPDDRAAEAEAAGFRPMSAADLRTMYNRLFMEHSLFRDKQRKTDRKVQTRGLSTRMQMMKRGR